MEKAKLHAFDFDGTMTRRDSLVEFIRYNRGDFKLASWIFLHLPWLVMMKLGLYDHSRLKERLFRHMFGGRGERLLELQAATFVGDNHDIVRPAAMAAVKEALARGEKVCIVSASPTLWVRFFFWDCPGIVFLCTGLEVKDGKYTGSFSTPNCYGEEKVRRLKAAFPERGQYHIVAYGDSRGDREMLAYADEAHYKPFRD